MSFITVFFKEIAESIVRNLRKLIAFSKNTDLNSSLAKDGLVAIDDFFSEEKCQRLRDKIDFYIDSNDVNLWRDECGADNRVYFINEIDEEFKEFYEHPAIRRALKDYTGLKKPKGMLLAARIDAKDGNLGSGGGWHRDSPISHQFKAICYLNDVDTDNGPFMYIKGSHAKQCIFKDYLYQRLKPGASRFNDSELGDYLRSSRQESYEATAKAGTLLFADTKGIHRGKPISKGSRYVLFCYFWSGAVPEHFLKLRQN